MRRNLRIALAGLLAGLICLALLSRPSPARAAEETVHVTLITGEAVTVTVRTDGTKVYSRPSRSMPSQPSSGVASNSIGGGHSAEIDGLFFDIDYLIDNGYHKLSYLPVVLTAPDRQSLPALAALAAATGGRVTYVSRLIPAVAVELPLAGVAQSAGAIAATPAASGLWLDATARADLSVSVPHIGANLVWANGYRGEGTIIAVLDTGINSAHDFLDDLDDNPATTDPKVLESLDFTDTTPDDIQGHGTHVASTAAGTGAGTGKTGVAPQAYLWSIKVLGGSSGVGLTSWILAGLDYAALGPDMEANTGDEADVINMSLGNPVNTDGRDPLAAAVDAAVAAGRVVVVSAGNRGPNASTLGTPGVAWDAITVGAKSLIDTKRPSPAGGRRRTCG